MTEAKAERLAQDGSVTYGYMDDETRRAIRCVVALNALRREIIGDFRERLLDKGLDAGLAVEHEGRLLKILEE